jgi:hypothetical protein
MSGVAVREVAPGCRCETMGDVLGRGKRLVAARSALGRAISSQSSPVTIRCPILRFLRVLN